MQKANAVKKTKMKTNGIEWYIPHYTPSKEQQKIISEQISSNRPTALQYVLRSIFMEGVKTRDFWTFVLSTQEGTSFLIWIIVGFQQRARQNSQNLNNDTYLDLQ